MRTSLALLSCLAGLGSSATSSAQEGPANAEPGRRLVVLEASVDRSVFQTSGADGDFSLCLGNTNRFSNPELGLLPGDRLVFMIPTGCGELGASCTVSVAGAALAAGDFGCTVVSDQLEVEYWGPPAPLLFGERICVATSFESPLPASCASELFFVPRADHLPPYRSHGVHRIANPLSPTRFTLDVLDPLSGPAGPVGPQGLE